MDPMMQMAPSAPQMPPMQYPGLTTTANSAKEGRLKVGAGSDKKKILKKAIKRSKAKGKKK